MPARWTQAMISEASSSSSSPWAPGRMQLYVDDPVVTAWGSRARRAASFTLVVLLWLVLGIPLSWRKGALHQGASPHTWIGVVYASPSPGICLMWLPEAFVSALVALCRRFASGKGHQPLTAANSLVGKAGRVAHVLIFTRPYVASLYAALQGSLDAKAARSREAPPKGVACKRFASGAQMLLRILGFADRAAPVPHCRIVRSLPPPPPDPEAYRFEIDASPWGGGGLLVVNGVTTRCFAVAWDRALIAKIEPEEVTVGHCGSQTFFETLVMLMAVELWGDSSHNTVILGDNTAALGEAIDLKGKGTRGPLSQILAVLIVARTLHLTVGHLPTEANDAADALSRQFEPENAKPWPFGPEVVRDWPLEIPAMLAWIR